MTTRTIGALVLLSFMGCVPPAGLKGVDLSPNEPNHVLGPQGSGGSEGTTAGIMIGLAGGADTLYGVSLAAGVWRSSHGGPWVQLATSPPRAYSIAVDPARPGHLAVGERDGLSGDPRNEHSGVWESSDGGDTFGDYFDPSSNPACAASQAVPSIAFTRTGSVVVAATVCGVAVRAPNAAWTFPPTPLGTAPVTAVATSATKIWARDAAGTLIVSTDQGASFHLATQKPLPAGTSFAGGGDASSLAAFDEAAMMSTVGESNGMGNTFNQLLVYDATHDAWVIEKRIFDPLDNHTNDPNFGSLSGLGQCECNGTRFVRAFEYTTSAGPQRSVLFSAGQELFWATGRGPVIDATNLSWLKVAAGQFGATASPIPAFQPNVHGDFWDALIGPPGNTWLATDGGIFEVRADGLGWRRTNDGLHTHHVNGLYAAPLNAAYAYPTTDNATWFAGFTGTWAHDSVGDSNWVVGDSGAAPPFAYAARNAQLNTVIGFDQNVPDADVVNPGSTIANTRRAADESLDGPLTFAAIQTMPNEPKVAGLDLLMLATMPLQYRDTTGALVTVIAPVARAPMAIVRNRQWLQHPDIHAGKGAGWETLADKVPAGTAGIVAGGGHQHLQIYALSQINGTVDLWRWDGKVDAGWTRLDAGGPILFNGFRGTVFVNPYDAKVLYVLTGAGIRHSTDGGASWTTDSELTSALTRHGTFPLTATFFDVSPGVVAGGHGPFGGVGTLADMAFDASAPTHVVAGSPFTGVFYDKGDGVWHDLAAGMPRPFTPVTSVYLFASTAVVGFEGRGLWRIEGLSSF